jgi:hypothetical protein
LARHAGVIGHDFDILLEQSSGQVVHVAAAQAVDDAGLAFVALDHLQRLLEDIVARQNTINEVGPIEVAHQHDRLLQCQLRDDVAANRFRGRRGVGVDGGLGEELAQATELPIFRTKIVAPMADAVGLVNGEGTHIDLLQDAVEIGLHEALGRNE